MKVVFMGTPEFAVPSLEALASRHDVTAVYTRPDRPKGRGMRMTPSPVKTRALELGLPVEQPDTFEDGNAVSALSAYRPKAICVAAFGMLLPTEVLRIPKLGCINVHASLLPRYRGAAPIQRALLQGDETTGVSIMLMEEGLDTGPYMLQVAVPSDDLYAPELTSLLAEKGAQALVEGLDLLETGEAVWTPQDDSLATYARKVTRSDVELFPDLSAEAALRRVRASLPSAPSRVRVDGVLMTVLRASVSDLPLRSETLIAMPDGIHLGLADGTLRLDRVKPEGRGEMSSSDYARGARIPADARWSSPS